MEFEINKSLDELVSEDASLRNTNNNSTRGGGATSGVGGQGGANGSGSSYSKYRDDYNQTGGYRGSLSGNRAGGGVTTLSGSNSGRDRDQKRAYSQGRNDDTGSNSGRDGFRARQHQYNHQHHRSFRGDEREMPPRFEQRDAYGKSVEGRRLFVSNLSFET